MTTEPGPALLADRYRLLRKLGSGSTADVHAAFDTVLGANVALKRFRDHSPAALRGLKAEFRTLADIHHPGLVKLFDLVVAPDTAFFTMELLEGVTFVEHARSASPEQLRRAVRQVGDAVAALHDRGKLHRDLKPGNVFVTAEGDARVLDFGLAGTIGASPMAGTLAYMAPELFEGAAPGAPADWYALGVLLYEALTGSVPGAGPRAGVGAGAGAGVGAGAPARVDVGELVLRKKTRRFARPRDVAPNVPADLDELVWTLLDPDPRTRASHASIAGIPDAVRSVSPDAPDGALFGRARELAALDASLRAASAGAPTLLVVEGQSGMGKTALVRTFLAAQRRRGCIVLEGAARPQELVPLRAIDAVIDDLTTKIEALPDAPRRALLAHVSPSLVRSFPVLASLDGRPADKDAWRLEALESRRDAQTSLARVLRMLSSASPLVVWIDDIQWADYESLLFLRAALDAGAGRILLVLTRRPGDLPWPEHERWLEAAPRLPLGPLDADAARSLLRARTTGDGAEATTAVSLALDQAGGNAFLIEFFARHAGGGPLAGALDIGAALGRALDALAPDARLLFECVALSQHPLPLAWLGAVVADRSRLRDQTATLTSSRLISVDERERVRPYHDALRGNAHALLDAGGRVARHALLADALRDHGAPAQWQIPHLEGAGRTEAAAGACLVAGDGASSTHAFEIAVQYFQKALSLGKLAPPLRSTTLEKLSDNLALMGRGREAADHYLEAAQLVGGAGPRAVLGLEHKRALALLRTGALDEGRDVLKLALRGVGERLPESNAAAVGMFVVERARRAFDRKRDGAAPAAPLDDAAKLRLDVLWTAGTSLSMYQPLPANALQIRFIRQALRANEPRRVVRALAMEMVFLSAVGGRYRAESNRLEQDLRGRFDALPWPYERAWAAASIGANAWLAGDLRRCRDWTARARQLFHEVPETSAFELALLDSWRLPAMALVGDFDEAVRTADELLAVATARGDNFASLTCLHGYMTLGYLAANEPELARARVEQGRARAKQLASPLPAFHQTWSAATLALHANEGDKAYDAVRSDWWRLRRSGAFVFESCVGDSRDLRARAALAAARAANPRRRAELSKDAAAQARWLRASTLRLGPALALVIEAQVAQLAGRDADAERLARRAGSELDALGLNPQRDALRRWIAGEPRAPVDAVFVPVR
jgi:hypothetical protein